MYVYVYVCVLCMCVVECMNDVMYFPEKVTVRSFCSKIERNSSSFSCLGEEEEREEEREEREEEERRREGWEGLKR